MRYALFGTGNYCKQFCTLFSDDEIIFYLDNDVRKKTYRGKSVFTPSKADFSRIDYVVIMVQCCDSIVNQLIELGVKAQIIRYSELASHLKLKPSVILSNDIVIKGSDWLIGSTKKKILCMMHDFSLTGVPVAVLNMGILFREMGYDVLIGSLTLSGPMEEEIKKEGLDYIKGLTLTNKSKEFETFISGFDAVLLGTIALAEYGGFLSFFNKPMIWWINENYPVLYEKFSMPIHRDNMCYFLDGKKTASIFSCYYPDRKYDMLYYYLPDDIVEKQIDIEKIVFAVIGNITKRKAQDIFLDAIELMNAENVEYWIIGSGNELLIDWDNVCKKNNRIKHFDAVSPDELKEMYAHIDVLVCPSRDDTAPIVVSQAFQNSVPCILSDAVGQSDYMVDGCAGEIFENENSMELALKMKKMIDIGQEARQQLGSQGRELFEKFFSKKSVMRQVMNKIEI